MDLLRLTEESIVRKIQELGNERVRDVTLILGPSKLLSESFPYPVPTWS